MPDICAFPGCKIPPELTTHRWTGDEDSERMGSPRYEIVLNWCREHYNLSGQGEIPPHECEAKAQHMKDLWGRE